MNYWLDRVHEVEEKIRNILIVNDDCMLQKINVLDFSYNFNKEYNAIEISFDVECLKIDYYYQIVSEFCWMSSFVGLVYRSVRANYDLKRVAKFGAVYTPCGSEFVKGGSQAPGNLSGIVYQPCIEQ